MSYVDDSLIPGEQVIHRTKMHRIALIFPIILAFLFWPTTLIALFSESPNTPKVWFLLLSLWPALGFLNYSQSEFAVTSKRVILKVGILRRRSLELLLDKVESISADQGLFGRIFGYGTVVVNGTGRASPPFPVIPQPLQFRKHVLEQVEQVRQQRHA